MRKDEQGNECPSTLGEYRKMCAALGGDNCKAVQFLNAKISESPNGENEEVIAPDSQMRAVLMPMLYE
jgi:hypothetical protein